MRMEVWDQRRGRHMWVQLWGLLHLEGKDWLCPSRVPIPLEGQGLGL